MLLFYGYTFCEVPRFVNVMSSKHCCVICKQLERYRCYDRLKDFRNVWYGDEVVGVLFYVFVTLGCYDYCFTASCANFLDVSDHFFIL